ncbi:hypothetical protein QL996_13690 [Planococcus sp. APC 4015]|nr:hypothetical protein [Planococcus sp. APC 4015]
MSDTPEKRPAYEPASRLLTPTGYDPDMPRPTSIYAGVGLILLRVVAGALILAGVALGWGGVELDIDAAVDGVDLEALARGAVVGVGGAFVVLDALFAFFVLRGRNWARVFVMFVSAASISFSFVGWWVQGQKIGLDGTFVSLSLDILILLALSSRSAAAYARRNERR